MFKCSLNKRQIFKVQPLLQGTGDLSIFVVKTVRTMKGFKEGLGKRHFYFVLFVN